MATRQQRERSKGKGRKKSDRDKIQEFLKGLEGSSLADDLSSYLAGMDRGKSIRGVEGDMGVDTDAPETSFPKKSRWSLDRDPVVAANIAESENQQIRRDLQRGATERSGIEPEKGKSRWDKLKGLAGRAGKFLGSGGPLGGMRPGTEDPEWATDPTLTKDQRWAMGPGSSFIPPKSPLTKAPPPRPKTAAELGGGGTGQRSGATTPQQDAYRRGATAAPKPPAPAPEAPAPAPAASGPRGPRTGPQGGSASGVNPRGGIVRGPKLKPKGFTEQGPPSSANINQYRDIYRQRPFTEQGPPAPTPPRDTRGGPNMMTPVGPAPPRDTRGGSNMMTPVGPAQKRPSPKGAAQKPGGPIGGMTNLFAGGPAATEAQAKMEGAAMRAGLTSPTALGSGEIADSERRRVEGLLRIAETTGSKEALAELERIFSQQGQADRIERNPRGAGNRINWKEERPDRTGGQGVPRSMQDRNLADLRDRYQRILSTLSKPGGPVTRNRARR